MSEIFNEIFGGVGSGGSGGATTSYRYNATAETNFNIIHKKGKNISSIIFDDGVNKYITSIDYTEAVDKNSIAFLIGLPFTGIITLFF